MIRFDEHIFQMGWLNHQLDGHCATNCSLLRSGTACVLPTRLGHVQANETQAMQRGEDLHSHVRYGLNPWYMKGGLFGAKMSRWGGWLITKWKAKESQCLQSSLQTVRTCSCLILVTETKKETMACWLTLGKIMANYTHPFFGRVMTSRHIAYGNPHGLYL